MSKLHVRRTAVAVAAIASLLAAVACVPPPAASRTWKSVATSLQTINQSNDAEFPDWDGFDEPYMMRVAFRVTIGEANSAQAWLVSTYPSIICKANETDKNVCPIKANMGTVAFPDVVLPDITDLAGGGTPVEILGTLDVMYEQDQLFPGGPPTLWNGVAGIMKTALNSTLASGAVPSTPEALLDLIAGALGPALSTVGGAIEGFIAGLGNPDDIVAIVPQIFIPAGGAFASILGGLLPGAIGLINTILINQPDSPFPDGLPIHLGITDAAGYRLTFTDGFTDYRVSYKPQLA